MDTAVSLVQSYLFSNGFFTVTEYPILETMAYGDVRTVTDIDVLGLRPPGAGDSDRATKTSGIVIEPDPLLDLSDEYTEVIIGEVKEGAAELNKAARDPAVLRAVLDRFGAMPAAEAQQVVEELSREGVAIHPNGLVRFRQMVFASQRPNKRHVKYTWVSHGHIVDWMREQLRIHWDQMKTIQSKNPTLSYMILYEKALRGED